MPDLYFPARHESGQSQSLEPNATSRQTLVPNQQGIRISRSRISERVVTIKLNRVLEIIDAAIEIFLCSLVPEVTPPAIIAFPKAANLGFQSLLRLPSFAGFVFQDDSAVFVPSLCPSAFGQIWSTPGVVSIE